MKKKYERLYIEEKVHSFLERGRKITIYRDEDIEPYREGKWYKFNRCMITKTVIYSKLRENGFSHKGAVAYIKAERHLSKEGLDYRK